MQVQVSSDKFAIIDDASISKITAYKWHVSHNGYAIRRVRHSDGSKRVIYMHKEVFGDVPNDIDHIDRDKLNNSMSNLRAATRTQNNANAGFRGGSSLFKGVCWHKKINRWIAYVSINKKRKHLGSFSNETEAAKAYNLAAKQLFGDFCRLNPI